MPVTVEARRLSGVDLGKTVSFTDGLGQHAGARRVGGELGQVQHLAESVYLLVFTPVGPDAAYISPADPVTITGRNP